MAESASTSSMEEKQYRFEVWKYVSDLGKWAIAGLAAVVSFYVIDVGKLKLETFKSHAENQRLLLQAYLNATESVQPDIWKRKLQVLQTYSDDERIRDWAQREQTFIDNYAEQDALYREAVKVASQLAYRSASKEQRDAARSRFEQLYWADLPYARESRPVEAAMVAFRRALLHRLHHPTYITLRFLPLLSVSWLFPRSNSSLLAPQLWPLAFGRGPEFRAKLVALRKAGQRPTSIFLDSSAFWASRL